MELGRGQKIRLGLFLTVCSVGLLAVLGTLLGLQLFSKTTLFVVRFKDSVSGLERGSPVKYQGLRVGRVHAMRIAADDPAEIEVDLELDPRTVLYEGTECNLDMGGLTGLKTVNITAGDPRRPRLPPGTLLPAGPSLFDKITDNAAAIVADVKRVADEVAHWMNHDNRQRLESLMVNLDKFVGHLDVVMMDSKEPLRGLIRQMSQSTAQIGHTAEAATHTLARLDHGVAAVEHATVDTLAAIERPLQAIDPQEVAATLHNLRGAAQAVSERLSAEQTGRALTSLGQALGSINHLIQDVDLAVRAGREDFTMSLSYIRQATEDLREFSRILAQNPSVLVRGRGEAE